MSIFLYAGTPPPATREDTASCTGTIQTLLSCIAAYLAKGNYNIIGVDWSVLCPSPNYIAAARNAVLTGELTAQLVEFLVAEAGARLQDVHIIGHSLGAQVAGFAGNSTITGKVARITGRPCPSPRFEQVSRHSLLPMSSM